MYLINTNIATKRDMLNKMVVRFKIHRFIEKLRPTFQTGDAYRYTQA